MKFLFFGKNLKYLRKQKGLNQTEMPNSIGFKASTWSGYELEKSFPKFEDFLKICEYFDISETDLLHKDLSDGGDYTKNKSSNNGLKGGDLGGNSGGDWRLNEENDGLKNGNNNKDASTYFLRKELEDKTATIADLRERINELKAYNSTLIERIEELRKDEQFISKRKQAG